MSTATLRTLVFYTVTICSESGSFTSSSRSWHSDFPLGTGVSSTSPSTLKFRPCSLPQTPTHGRRVFRHYRPQPRSSGVYIEEGVRYTLSCSRTRTVVVHVFRVQHTTVLGGPSLRGRSRGVTMCGCRPVPLGKRTERDREGVGPR